VDGLTLLQRWRQARLAMPVLRLHRGTRRRADEHDPQDVWRHRDRDARRTFAGEHTHRDLGGGRDAHLQMRDRPRLTGSARQQPAGSSTP